MAETGTASRPAIDDETGSQDGADFEARLSELPHVAIPNRNNAASFARNLSRDDILNDEQSRSGSRLRYRLRYG